MASKLLVSLGSLPLLAVRVPPGTLRLGRSPDNDIVLGLPEVADSHAVIVPSGPRAVIRSLAGEAILVNGRAAEEADLSNGDLVTLGGYRLRWIGDDRALGGVADDSVSSPVRSHATHPVEELSSAPGAPPTRLRIIGGPESDREIPLDRPAILVGRAPDSDLILEDETVSWRHLVLERTPEGIRVRDLGSLNGTYLDGHRIEAAPAAAGGHLRVGRTTLELVASELGADDRQERRAEKLSARAGLVELVGGAPPMRKVYGQIREAAASRVPVLLLGETGTGKELAARAIHALGPRARGPFVPINCAAVARDLLESELFGHARGAFTGAAGERQGAFMAAHGGTIFLDEIAELPLELQPKLLRVIEDGHVPRLGGGGSRSDFRLIAATNRDLAREVADERFRRDLYYRMAVLAIRMPQLRDHLEDLSVLMSAFLESAAEWTGVRASEATRFDEAAMQALRAHPWPGNVRELRNLVLRAAMRRPGGRIDRALVEALLRENSPTAARTSGSLEEIERHTIHNALRDCHGNRRAAARRLGIAESTLYEKIRRYGLGGVRLEG
jgi:DNA-binding NtrC family response regulator